MNVLIVLPVYNEASILQANTTKLHAFCQRALDDYDWRIVIADNGSYDESGKIGPQIAQTFQRVSYDFIKIKGKGGAVISTWQKYRPDIGLFIDADLAPRLDIIPKLIEEVAKGTALALGSRRLPGARVERTMVRRIVSALYSGLRQGLFKSQIQDPACGVKAVNLKVIDQLLPLVKNRQWFFDTEMIIWAEHLGYAIAELPVSWVDKRTKARKSKINLLTTSWQYLREMRRLNSILKNP